MYQCLYFLILRNVLFCGHIGKIPSIALEGAVGGGYSLAGVSNDIGDPITTSSNRGLVINASSQGPSQNY